MQALKIAPSALKEQAMFFLVDIQMILSNNTHLSENLKQRMSSNLLLPLGYHNVTARIRVSGLSSSLIFPISAQRYPTP
jgi:hypothetical protein